MTGYETLEEHVGRTSFASTASIGELPRLAKDFLAPTARPNTISTSDWDPDTSGTIEAALLTNDDS